METPSLRRLVLKRSFACHRSCCPFYHVHYTLYFSCTSFAPYRVEFFRSLCVSAILIDFASKKRGIRVFLVTYSSALATLFVQHRPQSSTPLHPSFFPLPCSVFRHGFHSALRRSHLVGPSFPIETTKPRRQAFQIIILREDVQGNSLMCNLACKILALLGCSAALALVSQSTGRRSESLEPGLAVVRVIRLQTKQAAVASYSLQPQYWLMSASA